MGTQLADIQLGFIYKVAGESVRANKNFISKTKVKHAIVVTVYFRFKHNLFSPPFSFLLFKGCNKKRKTVIAWITQGISAIFIEKVEKQIVWFTQSLFVIYTYFTHLFFIAFE